MHGSQPTERLTAAFAAALLLHAGLALFAIEADLRPIDLLTRDTIEIDFWEPPPAVPPPLPPEPEPVASVPPEPPEPPPQEAPPEPPPEPLEKEPEEAPPDEAEVLPEPPGPSDILPSDEDRSAEPEEAPPAPLPEVVEREKPSPDDAPVVRLPIGPRKKDSSLMGRIMGRGSDPFGTGLSTYEKALEFRADGPMSDKVRAEKTARRMIQHEMAIDAVSAGLADDYFRELRLRLETNWRPRAKDLSDGGRATERLGFMKDLTVNRAAWGEVLKLYLSMAKQYGEGESVKVDRSRLGRARELFRSKKGNFRFQAIAEVILTQAANGKVLTLEFTSPTGHDEIDEGIKSAFQTSIAVMPYEPPTRLSFGRAFRSKWRMRATWRMVPPTALLTGSGWDLTRDGLEVDVPFDVKLQTKIILQSFDNRSSSISPL